jgi:hypothetical protein
VTELAEGAACAPNMSAGARRVRARVARGAAVAAAVTFVLVVLLDAVWWVRWLAVLLPALVASEAYFEARSNVCILRAAQGTFEHDDRSRTPMASTVLPAIRRVAKSVVAKGAVTALLASAVATVLSLVVSRML